MSNTNSWKSIPEVINDLGLSTNPRLSWAAGAAMQRKYLEVTGTLPVKVLRRKTNRSGKHHFAVYSPEWLPTMIGIVQTVAEQRKN